MYFPYDRIEIFKTEPNIFLNLAPLQELTNYLNLIFGSQSNC